MTIRFAFDSLDDVRAAEKATDAEIARLDRRIAELEAKVAVEKSVARHARRAAKREAAR